MGREGVGIADIHRSIDSWQKEVQTGDLTPCQRLHLRFFIDWCIPEHYYWSTIDQINQVERRLEILESLAKNGRVSS